MAKKVTREELKEVVKTIEEEVERISERVGHLPPIETGESHVGWTFKREKVRQTSVSERLLAIEKYLGIEYTGVASYRAKPVKKSKKA